MTREQILTALEHLNQKLIKSEIKGELCLYGGAVFCIVFQSRPETKDVDAVFEPSSKIRALAAEIANEMDLREDWLNDGVKGFVTPHAFEIQQEWSHLKIYTPPASYLLAMKAMASRFDSNDQQDLLFLIQQLKISAPQEVFEILEHFYPHHQVPIKTQYFVEELFERMEQNS